MLEMLRCPALRRMSPIPLAGLLASCTLPMFAMPPGPLAYRQGYHDGCDVGYAVAGSPLYEQPSEVSPPRAGLDYDSGWSAGLYDCRSSFERIQRTVNLVLSPG
jgi:hypothetical protein